MKIIIQNLRVINNKKFFYLKNNYLDIKFTLNHRKRFVRKQIKKK